MDVVQEIKNRLSIEDVVAEYITLQRSGRNFKALSPFNNEKSPSFIVSPEKQIWHDFSSGKGGDVIGFVMEMEGLDFKQALELLAKRVGLDTSLVNQRSKDDGKKDKLYGLLELAAKYYQVQLKNSKETIDYVFSKRLFSKDTALTFRFGYAPRQGDALINFLQQKGYEYSDIKQAGLLTDWRGQKRDIFRGRMMIPLSDAAGRIIGFTARILYADPKAPKYINTPSTLLYDKSRHLYGLHLAKESIRKQKYVVVVEGNLDVVASHQAGVKNVVGAAGTALTEYHLKELKKFSGDIRFAFDNDRAGIAATERAIVLAQKVGVQVSIITIESGKDPDELIKTSVELWKNAVENPHYAIDWLMDVYQQQVDITTGQGKKAFKDAIKPTIDRIVDKVEKEHYTNLLAARLGVSSDALRTTGVKQPIKQLKRRVQSVKTPALSLKERYEKQLLSLLMKYPRLARSLLLKQEYFSNSSSATLFGLIVDDKEYPHSTHSKKVLNEHKDFVLALTLLSEELYGNLDEEVAREESSQLARLIIKEYVRIQKNFIREKLTQESIHKTQELLEQDKQLNQLLKNNDGEAS